MSVVNAISGISYCGCDPRCKPLGMATLKPGIRWSDVVREIKQFAAEAADPYGTGDVVPADLWGRRRRRQATEEENG